MEKRKIVNLIGVLGKIELTDISDMSFNCTLEKMDELKKVLDALEVKYQYSANKSKYNELNTQHVLRIAPNDELGYIAIFSYEQK